MSPQTGQVLRRLAYLIEILSMFGLLSVARGRIEPRQLAGLDLLQWMRAGLALGIMLWVVGTAAVYWPRKKAGDP